VIKTASQGLGLLRGVVHGLMRGQDLGLLRVVVRSGLRQDTSLLRGMVHG
jgi:hypothetical protein